MRRSFREMSESSCLQSDKELVQRFDSGSGPSEGGGRHRGRKDKMSDCSPSDPGKIILTATLLDVQIRVQMHIYMMLLLINFVPS